MIGVHKNVSVEHKNKYSTVQWKTHTWVRGEEDLKRLKSLKVAADIQFGDRPRIH